MPRRVGCYLWQFPSISATDVFMIEEYERKRRRENNSILSNLATVILFSLQPTHPRRLVSFFCSSRVKFSSCFKKKLIAFDARGMKTSYAILTIYKSTKTLHCSLLIIFIHFLSVVSCSVYKDSRRVYSSLETAKYIWNLCVQACTSITWQT